MRDGAATYYLDPAGNDEASGTSPGSAWKSVGRVNRHAFGPGERLLLRRGGVWGQGLRLRGGPLTVGAYAEGPRPRVNGGREHALTAGGPVSGWTIAELELTSTNGLNPARRITGGTCGVFIRQSEPCAGLAIRDCLIHDTSGPGIYLLAAVGGRTVFSGVVIERCEVYNASCGIQFYSEAPWTPESFSGFRISHVVVHDIGGDGIVPFCGSDGRVEHCTAYRTGLGVAPKDHSPVGIWLAWNRRCAIQFCESYGNKDGGRGADGGGFDIDGGCTDCVLQYNHSHDNEGAGYLICSFDPEGYPTTGSVCRFNLSVNDGLANGYAALQFWQAEGARVYNNTFVTRKAPGLQFASDARGHFIANNVFVTEEGPLVSSDFDLGGHTFRSNLYYRAGAAFLGKVRGERLDTLEAFVGRTAGQGERFQDPRLVNRRPGPDSPCLGGGLRIPERGDRDFFGAPLGDAPLIGCSRRY